MRLSNWDRVLATMSLGMSVTVPAAAAPVFGVISTAQAIGSVIAGNQYTITATGTVNLCPSCANGAPLTFNPDGTLATPVQGSYAYFNSGPHDNDQGGYGLYGKGINYGELYGTYSASPGNSNLFAIGYGMTFTASTTGNLYGVINDDFYGDNSGQFDVTLAPAATVTPPPPVTGAVPEPASWAMIIIGFGMVGAGLRRRRTTLRYA